MELRLINCLCWNYIVSSTYSVYVNKPTSILVPHRSTQVPQDEWGGYPGGGKDDEIPCRRMRSSSYVKAMGDEESGESDSSPKTSPQRSVRPDALVKAIIRPRDLLDSQRYDTLSIVFQHALVYSFTFQNQRLSPAWLTLCYHCFKLILWKIITRLNHLSATETNGEKFIHVIDLLSLSIIVFLVFRGFFPVYRSRIG